MGGAGIRAMVKCDVRHLIKYTSQALDLVGKRKVLIRGGLAYVPSSHVTSIIVARFRTRYVLCAFAIAVSWGTRWVFPPSPYYFPTIKPTGCVTLGLVDQSF